jgi:hypothetical protein
MFVPGVVNLSMEGDLIATKGNPINFVREAWQVHGEWSVFLMTRTEDIFRGANASPQVKELFKYYHHRGK